MEDETRRGKVLKRKTYCAEITGGFENRMEYSSRRKIFKGGNIQQKPLSLIGHRSNSWNLFRRMVNPYDSIEFEKLCSI